MLWGDDDTQRKEPAHGIRVGARSSWAASRAAGLGAGRAVGSILLSGAVDLLPAGQQPHPRPY